MESEKHNEWSSALDEDLIQDPVSAVIPPGPAPWSLSAGPWSSESSVPAVLHQSAEAHNYNRFIPSNETQSQTIQTEDWTEDRSTNTNENWESDMSSRISSLKDAMHHVVSKTDKTFKLVVKYINAVKGRGLFAKGSICKDEFVVEYRGDIINDAELQNRRKRYHTSSAAFMFEFKWRGKTWCIDASREDGSFGRIVNDDHKHPNCEMRKIYVNGKIHLCLFALNDIKEGEEITYDYGGEDYPWRTQMTSIAANTKAEGDSDPSPRSQTQMNDATGQNNSPQQIVTQLQNENEIFVPRLRPTKSIIMKDKDLEDSDELFDSTPESSDYYFTDTTSESDFDSDANLIPNQTKLQLLYDELDVDDSGSLSSLDCDTATPEKTHSLASEASGTEEPCSSQNAIEGVVVSAYQKRGVSRVYNKRHYCLYCCKPYAKMARHLESSHANESDVAKALSFPKSSKERKKQLDYIRNRGNYVHNAAVMESGKGELVPYKRPSKEAQGKDFMHCAYCQGLFARKVLWRHMRTCILQPQSVPLKPGKNRVQSMCIYTGPVPSNMTKQLWEVISVMNLDPITDIIKKDKVIIDVGQHLLNIGGLTAKNKQCVREKMRELGRLVHNARRVTSLKTMEDCVNPKKYMETVKAVKYTCGYESEKFMIPSLAKKLGNSLLQVSKLLKAQGLMSNDKQRVKNASEFQDVHQEKWNEMILDTALRNIREAKWNVPALIPFAEDVQKMHTYLSQVQGEWYKSLSESSSTKAWMELAKVCLAQIILFNRRRGGEVACMTLSAFFSRDTSDPHEDVDWALSEVEKKLCRHISRIITMGKCGQPVPILLTPKMLCSLELLVKQREPCGVLKDNVYMFAKPEAMTHFRGSDCLRGFAKACGAKCPKSLTSTRLRKHAAVLSTVLNMTETEMDQLANFLGHDIKMNREFCLLPEKTLQLAKICKVLMALEQGRFAEFHGKNLDEIVIDPDEKVLESDEDRIIQEGHCSSAAYEPIAEEALTPAERNDMPPPPKRQKPPSPPPPSGASAVRPCFQGQTTHKKNPWQQTEVQAVERHMMRFITSFTVPGKSDCEKCLKAEPEALKNRDWKNVKFFIYNRITAYKKSLQCK
uniref:SET domain-containing protein n=2 Tax=Cyprinus carpio carpio TaxID=630221 RepID=A0A9J7ZFM4_CYPCA